MSKTNSLVKIPDTQDVIDGLKKKIESINRIRDTPYRTNPSRIKTANGDVDVKTERNVDVLVSAFASVMFRAQQKDAAYTELGLDEKSRPLTKVDGFTVDDWKADVKLSIAITEQDTDVKELEETVKEWESLLDKEDKKKNLMKKIAKLSSRVGTIDIPKTKDDNTEDTTAEVV